MTTNSFKYTADFSIDSLGEDDFKRFFMEFNDSLSFYYRPYYFKLCHSLAADYEELCIDVDINKCFKAMVDDWGDTHPDDCKREYIKASQQLEDLKKILEKGKKLHSSKFL